MHDFNERLDLQYFGQSFNYKFTILSGMKTNLFSFSSTFLPMLYDSLFSCFTLKMSAMKYTELLSFQHHILEVHYLKSFTI